MYGTLYSLIITFFKSFECHSPLIFYMRMYWSPNFFLVFLLVFYEVLLTLILFCMILNTLRRFRYKSPFEYQHLRIQLSLFFRI